jgi:3-oxoacyl-[acyl-carrier-protein] synthase-3
MVAALREQLGTSRLRLLLSAFGVGLSWGSAIVETENLFIPPLVELPIP